MIRSNNRDISIDVLRFIALSGIIIAHVSPPSVILQLRNFDVPMMVFLSGVVFSLSSGLKVSYSTYVWKRFKRLILPMWIFVMLYVAFSITIGNGFPGIKNILFSYSIPLIGNWYTWIIRVFFIIALVAPIVSKYIRGMSVNQYLCISFIVLIIFEVLCIMSSDRRYDIVIMNIPYIVVFSLGTMVNRLSKIQLLCIMTISFAIFVAFALLIYNKNGEFIVTQKYKYPPRIYYTSYAIGAIILLYQFRKYIVNGLKKIKIDKLCAYIGSHTIWIYFYHIIMLDIIDNRHHIAIRYVVLYTLSIMLAFIQDILVQYIADKIDNENAKKNILILFRG